jgi:hypothetical protein
MNISSRLLSYPLVTLRQLQPRPEFFDHRIKMFEQLKAEHDDWVKGVFSFRFSAEYIPNSLLDSSA